MILSDKTIQKWHFVYQNQYTQPQSGTCGYSKRLYDTPEMALGGWVEFYRNFGNRPPINYADPNYRWSPEEMPPSLLGIMPVVINIVDVEFNYDFETNHGVKFSLNQNLLRDIYYDKEPYRYDLPDTVLHEFDYDKNKRKGPWRLGYGFHK